MQKSPSTRPQDVAAQNQKDSVFAAAATCFRLHLHLRMFAHEL